MYVLGRNLPGWLGKAHHGEDFLEEEEEEEEYIPTSEGGLVARLLGISL